MPACPSRIKGRASLVARLRRLTLAAYRFGCHRAATPLAPEERSQLEENLKRDGCLDALITWKGILLDGHNRYEICHRLGIYFGVRPLEFASRDDAKIWIIQNQFGRRNLEPFVRAELALALKPLIAEQAKARQGDRTDLVQKSAQSEYGVKTRDEVARAAGVSHDTIAKVERIREQAQPEIADAARQGACCRVFDTCGEVRL